MKWAVATLAVIACAGLLVSLSRRTDQWIERPPSTDARSAGLALVLPADAPVQGWTRRSLPVLNVNCTPEGVRVSLTMGIPVEVEPGPTRSVSLQFDDEEPVILQWVVSADRQSLSVPSDEAAAWPSRLASARTVDIAFIPLRTDPVVARFSVGGFAAHWKGTENCARERTP